MICQMSWFTLFGLDEYYYCHSIGYKYYMGYFETKEEGWLLDDSEALSDHLLPSANQFSKILLRLLSVIAYMQIKTGFPSNLLLNM